MTKDELLKKDWQLLTAYSNISTIAKLDTILQNQAVIIAHLKNIPIESVIKKMDEFKDENYKTAMELAKKNIPDYDSLK